MFKKFMKESRVFQNVFFTLNGFSKKLLKCSILSTAFFGIVSFLYLLCVGVFPEMFANILALFLTYGLKISILAVVCGSICYVASFIIPLFNTPHKAAMGIAYGILVVITVTSNTPFFIEFREWIVPCFCIVFAYTALEVFRLLWLDVPGMVRTYKRSMKRKKRLEPHKYTYDPEWDLEEMFEIYVRICIDAAAVMVVLLEYHLVTTASMSQTLSILIIAVLLNAFISNKIAAKMDYNIFISPAIILLVYGIIALVYSYMSLVEQTLAYKMLTVSVVLLVISIIASMISGRRKMRRVKKHQGF